MRRARLRRRQFSIFDFRFSILPINSGVLKNRLRFLVQFFRRAPQLRDRRLCLSVAWRLRADIPSSKRRAIFSAVALVQVAADVKRL